jgi:mRNA interferase RelE/StbE
VYEVFLEQAAERDLRKLDPADFHRLVSRIKALAENPRPVNCKKITGSRNDWRIRIGTYRVIYEIDEKAKTVNVMRIRHRREAYR